MSLLPNVDLRGSSGSGNGNGNNVEDADATLRRRSSNTNNHSDLMTVGSSNGSNGSSVRHRHGKSSSSLDVTAPVNLKSTPADPHLSDVNSVSSNTSVSDNTTALGSVNDIIERNTVERNHDKEVQAPKSGDTSDKNGTSNAVANGNGNSNTRFLENMISSFSFKSTPQNPPPLQTQVNNSQPEEISSPNIISHRRQVSSQKKNGKKATSPVLGPGSPTFSPASEAEKPKEIPGKTQLEEFHNYDDTKFVDETYLDTPFHYAVMERNAEFHTLFKDVSKDDRLLDDFSCSLSREFLYQGRMYISESHVCFYSSLLGWIAKVVIPFKDITFIEKTSTAGLFQNAVSIETATGKTQFNGFISRDIAFTLLKEVWARTLLAEGEKQSAQEKRRSASSSFSQDQHFPLDSRSFSESRRPSGPPSRASYISENDALIEDAIRSVDDVTPTHSEEEADGELRNASVTLEEDEDDSASENESETKSATVSNGSKLSKTARCYKFKPEIHYSYNGPLRGTPTKYKYSPEDNNEFVLAEVELNAPPGIVFQLLFGSNPSFWIEFFISQDSSKFTDFGEFDKVDEDGKKYREFNYAKGLHFPVGPKSTKCVVSEKILDCDYSSFIHVLNTTRTPDVPSGGSFSTKTRYMFKWASKTTCMLKVSYFMDWTASSWIKSMVESGARSGQVSATKDLVKLIHQYLDTYVTEGTVNVSASANKINKKSIKQQTPAAAVAAAASKPSPEARELKEAINKNTCQLDTSRHSTNQLLFIVIISLVLLIYNEVKLRGEIRELKTLFVQPSLDQNVLKDTIKNQILAEIKQDVSNL
ncbi:hypothetical protein ZYGR_0R01080 [Zygosaccharomyces rouxii]|uniref:VASt domain-containing protein n=1 Tax=Zygosaccharomyces rouxii TaxID=4956 RepID=A0A1Q3A2B2_ZYGRO|nr:hypothetical protein ZYGR_0R01080 [Zygosaccharomyces rouxii]